MELDDGRRHFEAGLEELHGFDGVPVSGIHIGKVTTQAECRDEVERNSDKETKGPGQNKSF
jgi:hypothetical protein